jgi:peroxiredoxin (alkyl hydroperoxide reductase subunit C)
MIAIGERIPEVALKRLGANGIEEVATAELFRGRRVALFGVPGAFTTTCSNVHLPGYVAYAERLRASGIDAIVCVSVNDPYVMAAWGEAHGAAGKVELVADWNGELARALGLEVDMPANGLGKRCRRFAAVVDDGVFTHVAVEPAKGVTVCGAENLLAILG